MTLYTPRFDLLTSASDLDRVASVRTGTVERVLGSPRAHLYKRHDIPKRDRSRGYRTVWEVIDQDWARGLRVLNRHLRAYLLEQRSLPGEAAHGYAVDRSIVTNARAHLAAPAIVRADIANFFGTITAERVARTLETTGLTAELSELIATLCCVDGRLALGLAPSPTIANVIADPVDARFAELLGPRSSVRYTRYADDLTFSGPEAELPSEPEIAGVLEREGFQLASGKYRRKKRGQAVVVTGLSVFDPNRPRVPAKFKRRIRQELYFIEQYGLSDHAHRTNYSSEQACINRLDGRIQFVRGVEPEIGRRLHEKWTLLLAKAGARVTWESRGLARAPATLFVDESVITTRDVARKADVQVIAMAMVIVRDVETVRTRLATFAHDLRKDWRRTGTGGKFLELGVLHYADLSEDVRAALAELLESLPFRAFVAYDVLDGSVRYDEAWLRLYRSLLRGRFMALDGSEVSLVVEQGTVVADEIRRATTDVFEGLLAAAARRPTAVRDVAVVSKTDDAGVWLPDAILGIFGDYARARGGSARAVVAPEKRPAAEARFERLRDRIRMVRSLGSVTYWGPKRPFSPWPAGRPG